MPQAIRAKLDLKHLDKSPNSVKLKTAILYLIHFMLGMWKDLNENGFQLELISGALTNTVYKVSRLAANDKLTKEEPQNLLLRIYGSESSEFVSRGREIAYMKLLSSIGIGPKILGEFANGRFEEYFDSVTLRKDDLRDPNISVKIACKMAHFHSLIFKIEKENASFNIAKTFVELAEKEGTSSDFFWTRMYKWQSKALNSYSKLGKIKQNLLSEIQFESFSEFIRELEVRAADIHSPVVFSHNDLQYGNILKLSSKKNSLIDGENDIMFIDFEYSSIAPRGFDIANHFCEWASDYHSEPYHKLYFDRLPSAGEKKAFVKAYIKEALENGFEALLKPNQTTLEFLHEIDFYMLCSHLFWGFWGIIKAGSQTSGGGQDEFDYFEYGYQRLRAFLEFKLDVIGSSSANLVIT